MNIAKLTLNWQLNYSYKIKKLVLGESLTICKTVVN